MVIIIIIVIIIIKCKLVSINRGSFLYILIHIQFSQLLLTE